MKYILRRRLSHLNRLEKRYDEWRLLKGVSNSSIQFYNFAFLFYFISFDSIFEIWMRCIWFSILRMNVGCWILACNDVSRIYIIIRMYDLHELHTPQWVGIWNKTGTWMLNVVRRFYSVNIMKHMMIFIEEFNKENTESARNVTEIMLIDLNWN